MNLLAVKKLLAGALSAVGVVAALLVATHPAGLSPETLSWLGAAAAICLAQVVLLPSVVAGTVNAADMKRAILEGQTPVAVPAAAAIAADAPTAGAGGK